MNLHGYVGTIGERWAGRRVIYQAMLEALLEMGGKSSPSWAIPTSFRG
ncbi:MAG: hypothetical protein IPI33_05995 [Dehalococcoidia bacterium]|nr:hypothetical protein [Dehalococcoidia bacterium]